MDCKMSIHGQWMTNYMQCMVNAHAFQNYALQFTLSIHLPCSTVIQPWSIAFGIIDHALALLQCMINTLT